jgi:hypothetical protein
LTKFYFFLGKNTIPERGREFINGHLIVISRFLLAMSETSKLEILSGSQRVANFRARASFDKHWPPGISGRHGVLNPTEKEFVLKKIEEEHLKGMEPTLSWLVLLVL